MQSRQDHITLGADMTAEQLRSQTAARLGLSAKGEKTMKLTAREEILLHHLRDNAESDSGNGFYSVYLDNARPDNWTTRTFAGVLSSLQRKGLYQPVDYEFFGNVKVDAWHDEAEGQ